MPNMNSKGPDGAGPLTGGGRGICRRTGDSPTQGQGAGQGLGRCGQGRGRGQRQGNPGAGMGRVAATQGSIANTGPAREVVDAKSVQQFRNEDNQKILEGLMAKVEKLEKDLTHEK